MRKLYVLRHKDWIKNWLGVVFFVLMLTVIPGSLLIGTEEWKALITNLGDYRTTVGTVVDTNVRLVSGRSLFQGRYTYDVWYQYVVDGVQFTSRVVNFADRRSSYEFALASAESYTIGSQVTVYYLPNEPSFAALAPNIRDRPFGQLIGVIAPIIIATLIILFAIIIPMLRYQVD